MDLSVQTGSIVYSTNVVDEYLDGDYRYLILRNAAYAVTKSYRGNIHYVLRKYELEDNIAVGHLTFTSIRQNISRRIGPKLPPKIFGDSISEAIKDYSEDFNNKYIVPLKKYILVRGQSSDDRDYFLCPPYTAFVIVGICRD